MEYRADLVSANAISFDSMISSLESLMNGPKDNDYMPSFRSSYINDVSNNLTGELGFTEKLFSTHPPLEKRIEALRKKSGKNYSDISEEKVTNLKKLI